MLRLVVFFILCLAFPLEVLAITVSNKISVSTPSSTHVHSNPTAAFDGNSTYLVVWEDWSGNIGCVRAARISSSGSVLDSSGITLSSSSYSQERPKVEYGGGVFLVVWQESSVNTGYNIKACRVNTSGTVLDSPSLGISSEYYNQIDPSLAYDPTNSRFFVVWSDFRNGTNYQIYGSRVLPNGTISDTSGISMYSGDSIYAGGYAYPNKPTISTNGSHLFISFVGARPQYESFLNYMCKRYNLDGTLNSTPYSYTSTGIVSNYPTGGGGLPSPTMGMAKVGSDFVWYLIKPARSGVGTGSQITFYLQSVKVMSDGTMGYTDAGHQLDICKGKYARTATGCAKSDYIYMFYEGYDNFLLQAIAFDMNPNIYLVKVSLDGKTAIDYDSPITITNTSNGEKNPSSISGNGGQILLVYEEDNLESYPDNELIISARLLETGPGSITNVSGATFSAGTSFH